MSGFDKQYLRDWLKKEGISGQAGGIQIPQDVISATWDRYLDAFRKLTETEFTC